MLKELKEFHLLIAMVLLGSDGSNVNGNTVKLTYLGIGKQTAQGSSNTDGTINTTYSFS